MAVSANLVVGDQEVMRRLRSLGDKIEKKIAFQALNASVGEGRKALRAAVPSRYKRIRKAVGSKTARKHKRSGLPSAMFGYNVGKKVGRGFAGHAAPLSVGTRERFTKDGERRGRAPKLLPSVSTIAEAKKREMRDAMERKIRQQIEKEMAKL